MGCQMSKEVSGSSKASPPADSSAEGSAASAPGSALPAAGDAAPASAEGASETPATNPSPPVKAEKTFERDAESDNGDIPTEDQDGLRLCLKVASGTHIGFGPLKKENQDELFVAADGFGGEEGSSLFCVFDGHGTEGKTVAVYVQKMLPEKMSQAYKALRADPGGVADADIPGAAMTRSFVDTNTELVNSNIDCSISGSTVSVALLRQRELTIGTCGDSRAVVGCKKQGEGEKPKAYGLSIDHRPARPIERVRVEAAGGRVQPKRTEWGHMVGEPRIWLQDIDMPGLLVSRSLGDKMAQSVGCSPEPELHCRTLDSRKDRWVIVASDGIWDVMSNQEVVDVAEEAGEAGAACQAIMEAALEAWEEKFMADNITVVVVQLVWKPKDEQ